MKYGKRVKQQKRSIWWKIGSILKLELECLLGIRDRFITIFFPVGPYWCTNDVKWHFLLSFSFLKIYSVSTTIILNKVIIFYSPFNIFWRWHFWLSKINVKSGSKIPWAENSGQMISFTYGALPLNRVCDSMLLRYVCRTVSCTIRCMKGAEINNFSNLKKKKKRLSTWA